MLQPFFIAVIILFDAANSALSITPHQIAIYFTPEAAGCTGFPAFKLHQCQ